MTEATTFYRATLHCRRCSSPYKVPAMAERFLYWFCHKRESGAWCGTMNIWNRNADMQAAITSPMPQLGGAGEGERSHG